MTDIAEPVFTHDVDVLDVADYLLEQDARRPEPDVTPLKLAKLLYLAQANYLASTGRRLFAADIEAYDNGPAVHRVWKRHAGSKQIIAARDDVSIAHVDLPQDVAEFLDDVWSRYQDHSASQLWRLTHDQTPWRDHYVPGAFRKRIPDEAMTAYFRELVPAVERVFHSNVVIMPDDFLDEDDAERFAERFAEYSER
ncbi:Panacea domain-containing protein [Pseudonocardia sp. WMMC193]|uniref:Panacea domain-containing protein n=1 Tax=Pseudonocardia sp. WMMC193 TaxID=2911965 RepID=UPI001F48BE77|nr:type II toxin-antitoxin system antitoxin SocA domain-containing protein [Pseudonocardia sp. WMMC193]MCF7552590.1 DUF4065 domain-containing protein [Pseudonocardia sp. WMMC193]